MNEDGLIERWNALTDARDRFLEELSMLEGEGVSHTPIEGWSALQVMEHIMSSERGTLGYLMKKTSSGWEILEAAGLEEIAAGEALVQRLESPERFKAPSVLSEPVGAESLESVTAAWDALREDFEVFLFSLDEEFYPRLVFRQPAAGPIHLFHTLEFLRSHIDHHIPQLVRIRESFQG